MTAPLDNNHISKLFNYREIIIYKSDQDGPFHFFVTYLKTILINSYESNKLLLYWLSNTIKNNDSLS